jgi:hypothetical protein
MEAVISEELKIVLKYVGIIWPIPPLWENMKEDLNAGH